MWLKGLYLAVAIALLSGQLRCLLEYTGALVWGMSTGELTLISHLKFSMFVKHILRVLGLELSRCILPYVVRGD